MLGLDVGAKRIGVAKSDEAGLLAHGLMTIQATSEVENIQNVLKLIDEYKVNMVVVGHPVNMNGSVGKQAKVAERFAQTLREAASVEVVLWDERLSSREAEGYLLSADLSRNKRKRYIDKLAAQIILQSYLDAQKKGI